MSLSVNADFSRLLDYLKAQGAAAQKRTKDSQEHRDFLQAFPLSRLSQLTLDEYCVGKGDGKSFCWWIERGLVPVLGRYMPGTARGHILYFQPDGKLYKNRRLSDLSDEQALRYTLAIQSTIAAADPADMLWVDDDQAVYQRAGVEALVTVGEGRKLRLLSCYHPEETLPISSSEHLGHYLKALGCAEQDIPSIKQPVARLMKLRDYFLLAAETVPGLSPYGFVRGLYSDELGLAPVKEEVEYLDSGVFVPIALPHGGRAPWGQITHVRLLGRNADTPKAQESLDFIHARANSDGVAALKDLVAEFPGRLLSTKGQLGAMRFDLRHFANARESGDNPQDKGLVELGYMSNDPQDESESLGLLAVPNNQILFGPPGTGKTYATIEGALQILDQPFLQEHQGSRSALKQRFDELVLQDRIRFVTFHQSFSYEDFVEGLRADADAETGQVRYTVESGVFKRMCDDARTRPASDLGVRANPAIWKISIAGTGTSPTKSHCLANGEARIGWGNTGDLHGDSGKSDYYQALGAGDKGTLSYFAEQMAVGDILLCIHSAAQIGSIGVVTSDYRYEERVPAGVIDDYQHVRSVRWLYRDINLSILPLNDGHQFTLKTVYAMSRFTWADLLAYLQQQGVKPVASLAVAGPVNEPYVLIIDEINRGNISRIFGELITLIEESKREGADEALSVRLPYSKKPFSVPKNVYLIGTMNTADRSLAGLDIALRRRFVFREMPPQPMLLDDVVVEGVNVGQLLRVMNQRIEVLLDRDHCLGHAYFMPLKEDDSLVRLAAIFRNQILPLLQEYFFEDWERISWVLNDQQAESKGTEPFIQRPHSEQSLAALFGSQVAEKLSDQRWELNGKAFDSLDSYLNILG